MNNATLSPLVALHYDGMMMGLHQFTEVDESVASYGATFYCNTRDERVVSIRREEKRIEFENGLKKKDLLTPLQ